MFCVVVFTCMTTVNIDTAEPSVEHTKDVFHTALSLFGFRPVRACISHLFFFLSFWDTKIKGICPHTQKYLPPQSKAFAFTIKGICWDEWLVSELIWVFRRSNAKSLHSQKVSVTWAEKWTKDSLQCSSLKKWAGQRHAVHQEVQNTNWEDWGIACRHWANCVGPWCTSLQSVADRWRGYEEMYTNLKRAGFESV